MNEKMKIIQPFIFHWIRIQVQSRQWPILLSYLIYLLFFYTIFACIIVYLLKSRPVMF